MRTARISGSGYPKMSASSAKYPVLRTASQNVGSLKTNVKFDQNGSAQVVTTKLVCWRLITNDSTIGPQENTPKIPSSGSRNSSFVRPPRRTQVAGVPRTLLRRALSGIGRAAASGSVELVMNDGRSVVASV